ncbi:MAG: pantoate--beta-alanine ligase, partial [Methyloceanibacter sp.]
MSQSIATVRTVKDLRAQVAKWRQAGEPIALVPTMGALHAGHLSLIAVAKDHAKHVVASIFVNPAQFGPKEDFKRYPRDEAGDVEKLAEAGVELVFIPDTTEIYPAGFATKVSLPSLTEDLCGAARPNHFDGVATVVTKLLLQCAPDVAVFGEKDYQQLLVIKQLVRDLNIPVQIVAGPIVREPDGLALSSRNGYLSPAERKTAPIFYQVLSEAGAALANGEGCDAASSAGRFKLE